MLGTSILSNKNTLSRNTQRIFIHLVLRLAANCIAFCTKSHCVLHQIEVRFAPKCTAFCTKMQRFLLQTTLSRVVVAILCNTKCLASAYKQPPFCTKRTLARIDYLRPSERLVNYKPLIMLKFIP